MAKWAWRHPTTTALVAAVFVAVLGMSAGSLFFGLYKTQQAEFSQRIAGWLVQSLDAEEAGQSALERKQEEEASRQFEAAILDLQRAREALEGKTNAADQKLLDQIAERLKRLQPVLDELDAPAGDPAADGAVAARPAIHSLPRDQPNRAGPGGQPGAGSGSRPRGAGAVRPDARPGAGPGGSGAGGRAVEVRVAHRAEGSGRGMLRGAAGLGGGGSGTGAVARPAGRRASVGGPAGDSAAGRGERPGAGPWSADSPGVLPSARALS